MYIKISNISKISNSKSTLDIIFRYKMLKHGHGSANPDRFKYLYTGGKRIKDDGYNSLIYKRVDIALKRLYTKVIVDLPHLKHGGKH